jgi:hypothetical protein
MAFYAKGMCKNCYHSRGREKLADKCPHTERANYAHGVCKNCYLSAYHRERRAANKLNRRQKFAVGDTNMQQSVQIDTIDVKIGNLD